MTAVATHNTVIKEFLEALGLGSKKVRKLELKMEINSVVVLTEEIYPDAEDIKKMIVVLREYELVPKKGLDGRRD